MQSIILIASEQFSLDQLYSIWITKSLSINRISDRLAIELEEGRIYVDSLVDGINEFDENEIKQIKIESPIFFLILYSEIIVLKKFLEESSLNKSYYIDDDAGNIVKINEFINHIINT